MLTYSVTAEQVIPNVATARAKRAQLYFDSSPVQNEHLMNPAELMLSAFAACMLKNVERFAKIMRFTYQRAAITVDGMRAESPPRMTDITYELTLWTTEPERRIQLLARNLRHHGTIYNTLASSCTVDGSIQTLPPVDSAEQRPAETTETEALIHG